MPKPGRRIPEFRREAVALVRSGRSIRDVAAEPRRLAAVAAQLGQAGPARSPRTRRGADEREREELRELRQARRGGSSRSERSSKKPRPSSRGRARPGDVVPVHRGGEGRALPVSLMCRVLGVSRSGFYAWETGAVDRALSDAGLTERIREIHARAARPTARRASTPSCASRGVRVGRKRVERLMREAGLSGLIRRRRARTTIRVPGVRVADDLVERDFTRRRPTAVVRGHHLRAHLAGLAVPAAVMDCYRRRIVGWSIADHLRQSSSSTRSRWRSPAGARPGLVHHSDRAASTRRCASARLPASRHRTSRWASRGDCFDNAVAESFFATLKKDLIHRRSWPTKAERPAAVFDYIEAFYNRQAPTLDARQPLPERVREDQSLSIRRGLEKSRRVSTEPGALQHDRGGDRGID